MKRWARKSKSLVIAFKIYQNWQQRRRFESGDIETSHGSTHSRKSFEQSISYISEQFSDYLSYSGLTPEQLKGKKILELGCGDNLGVALSFLAAGAERVVCVDKFYSRRDVAREIAIYDELRKKLNDEDRQRFDQAIDLTRDANIDENKLKFICGKDFEEAALELLNAGESFDIIISRAVLEEIYEPADVFRSADRLLKSGGLMLHKIDLSDYGIFSEGGMHPLTFLTIPDSIYRLMATDAGIPNRKFMSYYRRQMDELGYGGKLLVTSVVGHGPIVPHQELDQLSDSCSSAGHSAIELIRPKLSQEFKDMSDQELMVSGVFMVAQKPLDVGM